MHAAEDHLKALMLRGLDGDAQAQGRLLASLAELLRRFFARRLGREDADVEDLVQECLIAMHTRRETFDRSGLFTPWAYAIARYKLIDHYRRRRVRDWAPLEAAEELFSPDETEAATAAADVERLLGALPPKQAAAIARTRLDGLSTEEAARATGLSPSAVKVSVHRGMKALMARVQPEKDRAD
ncbi:MAG: sigma-70 family RNA polymerase sigma factor [Pseudomonadota bacterium]